MLAIYAKREQDKIDKSIFEVHPFLYAWSSSQGYKAERSVSVPCLRRTVERMRIIGHAMSGYQGLACHTCLM
jgi:hypothetical protein